MQSSLHNLSIAGENLSISTYSYNEGQATVLDVLQAQISWIQIYTNAITARFNYAVAVSEYQLVTGFGIEWQFGVLYLKYTSNVLQKFTPPWD